MSRDPDELNVAIGGNLRELRRQRGMSRQALGRVIGTTYQQVQKYEAGTNRLSARNLYVLARFFEVEIAALFHGFDGTTPAPETASTAAMLDRIARERPEVAKELRALINAIAQAERLNRH